MEHSTIEARSQGGGDLLERAGELQQLSEALSRANRGEGNTVLVGGEAGIGKTTLVERFIKSELQAIRLLKGACDPLSTPTPLGPLFDIAQTVGGVLEQRLHSTAPRPTIFSSVLDTITTATNTTVLFIEDAHWADNATLDLIRFLVRRTVNLRALLIFTFRDDEIDVRHPMRALLGSLAGQKNMTRIKPALLSVEAIATLIGNQSGNAKEIHRRTGGNPFYVTEVIGHAGDGLPSTIRDAVLARAARLSEQARHLVELVAVIGARADQNFLERFAWVTPRLRRGGDRHWSTDRNGRRAWFSSRAGARCDPRQHGSASAPQALSQGTGLGSRRNGVGSHYGSSARALCGGRGE